MNIFVLAVDSNVTEDVVLKENKYFSSSYIPPERYTGVINTRESAEFYTTAVSI